MSRETRLVVVLVGIALAGITTLALVAHLYQKRMPSAPAPAASSGSAAPQGGQDDPDRKARRQVEAFVAVRKAVQAYIAKEPHRVKRVVATITGKFDGVAGERTSPSMDVLGGYRQARYDAVRAAGITNEEYTATRTAFLAWISGGPVTDPALGAALAARADEVRAAALGDAEALDAAIR